MSDATGEGAGSARAVPGSRDELELQIADVIASVTGHRPESSADDLSGLGIDSLALLEVLARLEESFQVELTEDIVSEFKSVQNIVSVLREANKRFSSTGRGVDWDW